jgi:hypothetical protein
MVEEEDKARTDELLELCFLSAKFSLYLPEHERQEVAGKYQETLEELYATGWDDIIEMQCSLPPEYMPEEYLRRYPGTAFYSKNEDWLRRRPTDE